MNYDIGHLLRRWDYTPGATQVRQVKGRDGLPKLQLRLDLGILQMEVTGRPDGKKPMGHGSWLEFYQKRLKEHQADAGSEAGFELAGEDCERLHHEAIQYYHRAVCLGAIGDHEAVVGDARHNLAILHMLAGLSSFPQAAALRHALGPQVVVLRTRSLAEPAIARKRWAEAARAIEQGIADVKAIRADAEDEGEPPAEVEFLEGWLNELRGKIPLSPRQKLERQLDEAVRREDYETAAKVRDQLKNLGA
ncbi:MAG TPA: UvrB/UvrC motif-containing protein [Verrucomicrobiota bacterium]|nr:UvrB/UvrC motif-containing protein [Verrucomicrobiota bacterium]